MPDVNAAPQSALIQNLEPQAPTQPAQGPNLSQKAHDLTAPTGIKEGRVEAVYGDSFCAIVTLFGYRSQFPCLSLQAAMGKWVGAKKCNMPPEGTHVLVWMSPSDSYGIILGQINSPSSQKSEEVPQTQIGYTPVQRDAESEIHKAADWGAGDFIPAAGNGMPNDLLPGDDFTHSEMGPAEGVLKFLSILRGGDGAKIEAFIFDELLRVTGNNLQIRTTGGEQNILCDQGFIDDIEEYGFTVKEGLGLGVNEDPANPEKTAEGRETGRWRWKRFRGYLGGILQRFVVRPNAGHGDMDQAQARPDMGMNQEVVTRSGHQIFRTITGVGMHKSSRIAVPKRMRESDDPEGDRTAPNAQASSPFVFSPGMPEGRHMQLRDYFAWMFNSQLPQRLLEKPKDWTVPDEATCPTLADPTQLGIGGFYREFPPEKNAAKDATGGDFDDDTAVEGSFAAVGEAWAHVLPDGSVHARDIWGTEISTRGGHAEISASKDIRFFAGGSIILMAGDDIIAKARKSVDITSTKGQVRLRGSSDVFVASDKGGILLSVNTSGQQFSKSAKGEAYHVPGICMRAAGGGISLISDVLNCNTANYVHFGKGENGNLPYIFTEAQGSSSWWSGGVVHKFGSGYSGMFGGSYYGTGNVQVEGDCYVKGSVVGSTVSEGGDWSQVPSLASQWDPSFTQSSWDKLQYPIAASDLSSVEFRYRTESDYATQQGVWFESAWQRETPGLEEWDETAAADGSYPYPGKSHYTGSGTFWTYKEQNVNTSTGTSKSRDTLRSQAGTPTRTSWNTIKVHPSR